MKIFKRIYYSVMAALIVLMLTFSIIDSNTGSYKNRFDEDFMANVNSHINALANEPRNIYNNAQILASRNYIQNYLKDYVTVVDDTLDTSDNLNDAQIAIKSGKVTPTLVVQTAIVSQSTQAENDNFELNHIYVGKEVNNIAVYIPGTDTLSIKEADRAAKTTAGVVMMTAHYDSVENGAMDNAASAAAMLENIRYIIDNELSYKNDLLFVFTDAEEEGLYGAHAFYYQFKGFENVVGRVKMGSNFDSLGNKGNLLMFQTSSNNQNLISTYAAINKGTFTSSIANFVYNNMNNSTDFEIYGDIPSLNFANVGGTGVYHSALDNLDNANQKVIKQMADMMFKVYDYYGGYALDNLTSNSNAVFFSYLDIGTVWYPSFVSFILGGIIVGLLAAVIILNKRKKAFSWLKAAFGAFVQLASMAAALVVMYGVYYLALLLMAGFNVMPLVAIGSLRFMNVGILLMAMCIAGCALVAFYLILKKVFLTKGGDVVRGNALIWALLGLILAFAAPTLAYPFVIAAILELTVMLLVTIFKTKYKAKYGNDIERLFLYVVPMIICMPLLIPMIFISATVLNTVMLPVILLIFMLMAGTILPYANYLKPVFDKVAKKLPQRNVKHKELVMERVEDKAKKGKFTETEVVKIVSEKVDRKYYNRGGILAVSAIAFAAIITISLFGGKFSQNLYSDKSVNNLVYSGSIVYVYDQGSPTLEIKDKLAYNHFASYIKGYKWDSEKKAYVKEYNNPVIDTLYLPTITNSGSVYQVTVYDTARGRVSLKMSGTRGITKFIFSNGGDNLEYTNSELDTFNFEIPYGWGNFSMTVEGSASGLKIDYSEKILGNKTSEQIDDVILLREKFADKNDVKDNINSSIIINISKSF